MPDAARNRLWPVRDGRHYVAVGRKRRGAEAVIGQPTTLAAAESEADSMRIRGFDRHGVYELVLVEKDKAC